MGTGAPRAEELPLGGRFRVEREVGRGGVGIVYRAIDATTDRAVALKVIQLHGADPVEAARFDREGRLLAEIRHPHVVELVAFGRFDDGSPYVAMEWLDGEDLAARVRRAPLRLEDALEVARQVATALAEAHGAGVVHRDVKPSNVFLVAHPDGRPRTKLVDFGVASESDVHLTRTGVVVGTPAYMAPEQARGEAAVDARADLYSLGAMLFELVAGRPPHVGPTAIATLARLVTTEAPALSQLVADVPPDLDELVGELLATSPERRPASAAAVAARLAAIAANASSRQLAHVSVPDETHLAATQGTRLVTTLVALRVGGGDRRAAVLGEIRRRGADAVPLGHDAVVAHLGARRALGDEAARALDIARWLAGDRARVGVATGRTHVDLSRPVGEVVDRAAGLAHGADAGSVLADADTAELARERFVFERRPDGSSRVAAALDLPPEESATAPFCGRDAELAQLVGAYDRCADDATPVVVTVAGPPGIGKTRLLREAIDRLAARDDAPRVVLVRCEPFGRARALGVASDVVRAVLGLPKSVSLQAATQAVHDRLQGDRDAAPASAAVPRSAPSYGRELLARLVADAPLPAGPDGRGARDALWIAMTDLVVGAASRPCVLALDDLQWADPESLAWLDHALGRAPGRPLLLLGLVRPGFWREQAGRFAERDHVRVELRPIARRAARSIASAVLGRAATEETLERIASQAAGSPLFAEELARLVALGRDADNAPTIEAAIQVSLDALDDAAREAVSRMAIFGVSSWEAGLVALGLASPSAALRQLAAADLVVERPASRFAGTREWAFKHALVRDVAYAALAPDAKKQLHALAGAWLARAGEDAATIAQHFELGGRTDEAASHWQRAARRALATNALEDAVRMAESALAFADEPQIRFERALLLDEAWSRLDPRASDRDTAVRALEEAVFDEASAVRATGARARYDDARGAGGHTTERLAETSARAAGLSLWDEQARCLAALAARLAFAADLDAAERAAAELLELASARDVPAAAVDAWQTLGVVRQTRGELTAALEARRSAARAAREAGLSEREAMLTVNVGFALTTIGARAEARRAIESGVSLAQAIGSSGTVRHGRMNLLGWTATFGPDPALDPVLAETRAEADAAAGGVWVAPDRSTLGVLFYRACELMQGSSTEACRRARKLLRSAAEGYRATGNRDLLPVALGVWAEAERRCGEGKLARELAEEGVALLDGGAPSLLNEAPVYLALHDACVDDGDLRAARAAVARAMPPLLRRLHGLAGTPYARSFLTQLPHNAGLLGAAEAYGVLPAEVERLLEPDG